MLIGCGSGGARLARPPAPAISDSYYSIPTGLHPRSTEHTEHASASARLALPAEPSRGVIIIVLLAVGGAIVGARQQQQPGSFAQPGQTSLYIPRRHLSANVHGNSLSSACSAVSVLCILARSSAAPTFALFYLRSSVICLLLRLRWLYLPMGCMF